MQRHLHRSLGRALFCSSMHLCRLCRLREWYHALLRQAKQEGIVTYISNLYDTFFEGGKDHRVDRPSATHLPYFEGAPEGQALCSQQALGWAEEALLPQPVLLCTYRVENSSAALCFGDAA